MTTSRIDISLQDLFAPSFFPVHTDIKRKGHTHYWLKGGRGSSKSSFVGAEIPYQIMRDAEHGVMSHAVVLRRYGVTMRESVYEQLQWAIQMLGVTHKWQSSVNPMKLTYLPTGQSILFRGVDDATKLKSLKVSSGYVKYIWFEEVNEFEGTNKIRNVLQSLMRGGSEFAAFYTYNPPQSARNWVNRHVLTERPDTFVHHSTYLDVPQEWLGEQFITEAEMLYELNEKAYKHEYLGEVTGTGGTVFENVRVQEMTEEEVQTFDRIYSGVDWGWFPDPWAYNRMHYNPARRTLHIFDEGRENKKSNEATAEIVLKKIQSGEAVTCDAEKKSVEDYRSYGIFARPAAKGPGSRDYSYKWLQSLCAILIDPVRCPHTLREFQEYEYDRDRDGEWISGYPDGNDHHIDAVRYGMEPVWRRRGQ